MQSALATEYSPWSAWQEDRIAPAEGTEVESAERAVDEGEPVFRYTRYEYFNELEEKEYAAPTEQTGAHVRAGSGHWAEREESAPLKVVGERDGRPRLVQRAASLKAERAQSHDVPLARGQAHHLRGVGQGAAAA